MELTLEGVVPIATTEVPIKRYEICDRFQIAPPEGFAGRLDVWCPMIPDTPYQRVLDVSIDAPGPYEPNREPEFGNLMLHAALHETFDKAHLFEIRYVVERLRVPHRLDSPPARPLAARGLFTRALAPEQYVDVDLKTQALAEQVVGDECRPLERARRIYDYVTEKMTYNAAEQSWKGSTEHALVCSVGNCNDIHALFVSLCRSLGIPARFVLGQALEAPPPGQDACELCGYHCWAEFFVSGLGWVPADASCACKYGKHELFGDLEMNHIAWSVGRDIRLEPPQCGSRLLFFAGPYAEIGCHPHSKLERHIRFSELS